jgi:hypothetical protein
MAKRDRPTSDLRAGHHLTAQVTPAAPLDGRPKGTKSSLSESRLNVYLRRARLTPGEAEEWAAAGIGPYEAGLYRSAGLILQSAIRCRRAGVRAADFAGENPAVLLARVEAALRPLAPLDERYPEVMVDLEAEARRCVALAFEQGLPVDIAAAWIGAGGPIDDNMYAWVLSGAAPGDARRLASWKIAPPAPGVMAGYRAAGFAVDAARPWMERSIPARPARAFSRLRIDPDDAAAFIARGVSPAQAGLIRGTEPDLPATGPPACRDPHLAWTPDELGRLNFTELRRVLTMDLRAEPSGDTAATLRAQILAEQGRGTNRGTVRWIAHGVEEAILYDPAAARRAIRFVAALRSIASWRDLARLVQRGHPAGREALEYLWDEWCNGLIPARRLGLAPDRDRRFARSLDLLEAVPGRTRLRVSNRFEDGGFRFIDPYDPGQMGVPILVVDRYSVNRSNLVCYREVVPQCHLAHVRSTLEALGWRLRRGSEADLAPIR